MMSFNFMCNLIITNALEHHLFRMREIQGNNCFACVTCHSQDEWICFNTILKFYSFAVKIDIILILIIVLLNVHKCRT